MFVPLVSEAAIAAIKIVTPNDLCDDNVLLEYEHAIALNKAKRVAVLPVLIGQRTRSKLSTALPKFDFGEFGGHKFPANASRSSKVTVRETMNAIFSFQGLFLERASEDELTVFSGLKFDGKLPQPFIGHFIPACSY